MESTAIEEIEKWFVPTIDVYNSDSDVRFSFIKTCFTGTMMSNRTMLRVKSLGKWTDMEDRIMQEIGAMGQIAGDERWLVGQISKINVVVAYFQ